MDRLPVRRAFAKWLGLPLRRKLRLLRIATLAALAELVVRVVPLPRLTHALGIDLAAEAGESSPQSRAVDAEVKERASDVARVFRAWPGDGSCLRRSLVLGYLIRDARPVMRLGVGRTNGEIEAHAWIEVDGHVVGPGPGHFAPLRGAAGGPR